MAEYIEKQRLMEFLDGCIEEEKGNRSQVIVEAIKMTIERMPLGDVVERKRGKWVKNEGRVGWHCSNCGVDNNYAYSWNNDTGRDEVQDNVCPNCGADMRDDDDIPMEYFESGGI